MARPQEQALQQITKDALYLLKPFFSETCDHERTMTIFHKRITTSAWGVSRQLRTSSAEYYFVGSHNIGTDTVVGVFSNQHRDASILIDADTGLKVRGSKEVVFDSSGNLGQCLCVIFPALARTGIEGQEVRIGKMTLLVKFNEPGLVSTSTLKRWTKKLTG